MTLQVREDGSVRVHAPFFVSDREIHRFVEEKSDWISKTLAKMKAKQQAVQELPRLTRSEEKLCREKARQKLEERTAHFARQMGVSYGRITIRDQKTRWGSCSSAGNLNYNWKLILAPEDILDYVVVHELAHRKEMNHSPKFWKEVENILPDYQARRDWLKKNGFLLQVQVEEQE